MHLFEPKSVQSKLVRDGFPVFFCDDSKAAAVVEHGPAYVAFFECGSDIGFA